MRFGSWIMLIMILLGIYFFGNDLFGWDIPTIEPIEQGRDYLIDFLTNSTKEAAHDVVDEVILNEGDLKIASWNIQIFGLTKASKPELMQAYVDKIKQYDIFIIQEIRDRSGEAYKDLCRMLPVGYSCEISSRAGTTTSKEQYGIIMSKRVKLIGYHDYAIERQYDFERPPFMGKFSIDGYNITLYTIHTKPIDVPREMANLEELVLDEGNVIVLGDLNADCSYYNNAEEDYFDSWNWLIRDFDDTTVSSTDCAYDRIIMNDDSFNEYVSSGIDTEVTSDESDHYLLWVRVDT